MGDLRRISFAALALVLFAAVSSGTEILMNDGNLYAMGTYSAPQMLAAGDEHLFLIDTTKSDSEPEFDVEIILEVLNGDSDLKVQGPVKTVQGEETNPGLRVSTRLYCQATRYCRKEWGSQTSRRCLRI